MAVGTGTAILGSAAIGALAGGKGKGTTQTTQTSEPWSKAQPYMTDVMKLGQNLYNQNYVSPYTTQAQNLTANRALQGSPLMRNASSQLGSTISGNYLDPYKNPYFSGALSQAMGDVKSQINSQFTGDNFGSSAHQEWLGKGLTNAAMPMLANFYNSERGNQMNAMGMAPAFAQQDYSDLDRLGGVGAQQESSPWDNLFRYQQAVSGFGNTGGTTTSQQPYYQNQMANALGTGLNAAMLFKVLGQEG